MAALLVAIAVMGVAMTVLLPAWRLQTQRENEEELVFRGRQYVRAVQLFQRKYAAAYPPDVDTLIRLKFLRKKYTDPMVKDGEFEILYQGSIVAGSQLQGRGGPQAVPTPGAGGPGPVTVTFDSRSGVVTQSGQVRVGGVVGPRGGVVGVRSKSIEPSIRVYNGATHYNEWQFVFVPRPTTPGMRGGPGGRGGVMPGGGPGGQGVGVGSGGGRGMGPGGGFPGDPGGMGQRGGGRGGQGGPGRGGQGGGQPPSQRGGRGQIS